MEPPFVTARPSIDRSKVQARAARVDGHRRLAFTISAMALATLAALLSLILLNSP